MPTADSGAILESLGLIPVINAAGFPSRLGGASLSPVVRAAMDAAAQNFIRIAEMEVRASEIIAEAGLVASGGAACLTLAAACITGDDPAAIDRLPDRTGLRNEVVVHRTHRNPFDHAIRVPGARFVEFGYLGVPAGVGAYRWQLDAAITEKTAAVFYLGQPTD
jgi:L-seryl-tRNA(Ser) seleniumtransferase